MTGSEAGGDSATPEWVVRFGHDELVIRQRYEVVSIANDILIGVWFLVGSILFFSESSTYWGTWLFVLGSVEMLIRPLIRLVRRVHLERLHPESVGSTDAGHDF